MPYCPDCLTEYVEGISTCDDCGATLLPGAAPEGPPEPESESTDDSKMVPVRVFTGATAVLDADMARNILKTQGIPSFVPGEISLGLLTVLDVSLLVREDDVERAAEILRDYLDSETASPAE